MRKITYIIVFSLTIFLSNTLSQNIIEIKSELIEVDLPFGLKKLIPKQKPVVGIALSGGGARGLSQIGVLKALEEHSIIPDLVVGTSMGSIVGGLYASGYDINALNEIATSTNWDELLTIARQSNRKELFVDQKISEDKAVLTLRLDGLNPVLPTAFNDGQKLSNYLNIITFNAPIQPNKNFDLLKKRFRAVCTNLVTGDPVILNSGTLSKALRASSSVTFFLPPVQMDSLLLVDGGLAENIPVNIARKEGADFIIAVNTTSPLHSEERLATPWIIADQIVSIPIKHLNSQQLDSANIVITPDLNDKPAGNFNDIENIILSGYNATIGSVQSIKEKYDSLYQSSITEDEVFFENPYLTGEFSLSEKEILDKYVSEKPVSNKYLLLAINELIASGEYVDLSIMVTQNGDISEIKIIKKFNPVIKRIDLIGSSAINSDRTGEIFSSLYGKHYSAPKLLNALTELLKEYRQIGYSLANVSEIIFNGEDGLIKIYIDEGIISSIVTEGNTHTNKNVITREFAVKEGDFFNIDRISKGLINLRGTKLFEDSEVFLRKENGKNILVIKVIERQSQLLRLGFSVDNERRARLSVDVREENLFGSGTELGLIFLTSAKDRGVQLEHRSNRIFDTYFTYKLNAFYNFEDISAYRDKPQTSKSRFSREKTGEYRQIFLGASFGIGTQVERFGNLIFEGKYQLNRAKSILESPILPQKNTLVSLKVNATIDTQDKYPYPENGIFFNGFYETAQTFLGGDIGFTNVGFDYRNFLRLSSVSVLSTRINMGFADKTLPLTQHYSLGGLDSFFGMREDEYRGRQLFLTSLMYRYKLPVSIFFDTYVQARYDLGNAWEIQEQIKFKNLKHGIGIGISLDTPIGPAEFALGRSFIFVKDIPENPISWGDVQFYFSIGYYY
ncbi:MAG TPA: patatin-like phospholipase family protein [Ignavibacteriaceae bacterium]|nr:patatin-like phospholipase family protein [Ignavibacteriaceae bacterium]